MPHLRNVRTSRRRLARVLHHPLAPQKNRPASNPSVKSFRTSGYNRQEALFYLLLDCCLLLMGPLLIDCYWALFPNRETEYLARGAGPARGRAAFGSPAPRGTWRAECRSLRPCTEARAFTHFFR